MTFSLRCWNVCPSVVALTLDIFGWMGLIQSRICRRRYRDTRVIHLHGIAERDHRSLAFMPQEKVQLVLRELIRAHYQGVLTLEMFSQDDFLSSLDTIEKVLQ